MIEGQWWKVTPIAPAVTPGAPHRLLLFPEARNVKNPLAGNRRHFLVHCGFFLAWKKRDRSTLLGIGLNWREKFLGCKDSIFVLLIELSLRIVKQLVSPFRECYSIALMV